MNEKAKVSKFSNLFRRKEKLLDVVAREEDPAVPSTTVHEQSCPDALWNEILEGFRQGEGVFSILARVGLPRRTFQVWCKKDKRRAADVAEAKAIYLEGIERKAAELAFEGYDEEQFYVGQRCGVRRRYLTAYGVAFLSARVPGYQRTLNVSGNLEHSHEHTHSIGMDREELHRDMRELPQDELVKKYKGTSALMLEFRQMLDEESKAAASGGRPIMGVIIEHEEAD